MINLKKRLELITDKTIENDTLIRVLLEMNRVYDKEFTSKLRVFLASNNRKFDSFERKMARHYYYMNDRLVAEKLNITNGFPALRYNDEVVNDIFDKVEQILKVRDERKILRPIVERIENIQKLDNELHRAGVWLNHRIVNENSFSSIIMQYDFNGKTDKNSVIKELSVFVGESYKRLENYRYVSVVFNNRLLVDNIDYTFDVISEIAPLMENFKEFKGKFFPFKKSVKTQDLKSFLYKNEQLISDVSLDKVSKDYYSTIEYGFRFEDLLISEDTNQVILIMKKIELDEKPIPCPACLEKNARGNSYPLMFLKSWECSNHNCLERSKSGRGKRFDEYGTLRYFKLVEHEQNNIVPDKIYVEWRKDVYKNKSSIYDMLLLYYSWSAETVLVINIEQINNTHNRDLVYTTLYEFIENSQVNISLQTTKIYTLFNSISKTIKGGFLDNSFEVKSGIYNNDSSQLLSKFPENSISCAITSPPYYNAREYSQWPDFITYLVDMMINAKRVYDVMSKEGTYIYNVGDIIGQDNVFVKSQMSNRRLMLGFYSALVFKMVGFKLMGDIIWNKGEVQSKRNSTPNHFSGYLKFVNCYEHNLIFRKTTWSHQEDKKIVNFGPVIKINSKGENNYGHTAPYPLELVELIKPYTKDLDLPILDPYLGSGTTAIWCKKNGIKYVGIELNDDYFSLAIKKLKGDV
jgi:DNA modification methylase